MSGDDYDSWYQRKAAKVAGYVVDGKLREKAVERGTKWFEEQMIQEALEYETKKAAPKIAKLVEKKVRDRTVRRAEERVIAKATKKGLKKSAKELAHVAPLIGPAFDAYDCGKALLEGKTAVAACKAVAVIAGLAAPGYGSLAFSLVGDALDLFT